MVNESMTSLKTLSVDHFVRDGERVFAGKHLIIDCYQANGLDDKVLIEQAFNDIVQICGATLLHMNLHVFDSTGGISGVAVLAESHISVHTWPEVGFAAFDVFMCGSTQPCKAVDILHRIFNPQKISVQQIERGESFQLCNQEEVIND